VTERWNKLAAYIRVSTAAQAASGVGLAAQRDCIASAADVHRFEIVEWFDDAGKSGARMANRQGLQAALHGIRAGEFGGLVVAKIDRLGRSYEVMTLVGDAARERWRLLALDVGLDTTTAEGELVAGALTMASRFEWRRISQRQLEKHEELRRQGRLRGPKAVPAEVADRMRTARRMGWSFQKIADVAMEEGIPPVRGKRWHPSSVRSAVMTRERELAAQAVGSAAADEG
jgi:DNA invertase Pin-like site-specific DNA recombinase